MRTATGPLEWDVVNFRFGPCSDDELSEMPDDACRVTLTHSCAELSDIQGRYKRDCNIAFTCAVKEEAYLADPNFVDVPIEGLLNPSYLEERALAIDIDRAADHVAEGDPWSYMDRKPDQNKKHRIGGRLHGSGPDTTHFCVVDRWGNAVGELQSIQTMFGSCVIAGSTGILLNNRMTYWHLDPDHIDFLRPGQRVRHTMNPVMCSLTRSKMVVNYNLFAEP